MGNVLAHMLANAAHQRGSVGGTGAGHGRLKSGIGAARYALEIVFILLLLALASEDDNGDERHGQNSRHQLHCSLRHDLAPVRPHRKYKTNPGPDASTRSGIAPRPSASNNQ